MGKLTQTGRDTKKSHVPSRMCLTAGLHVPPPCGNYRVGTTQKYVDWWKNPKGYSLLVFQKWVEPPVLKRWNIPPRKPGQPICSFGSGPAHPQKEVGHSTIGWANPSCCHNGMAHICWKSGPSHHSGTKCNIMYTIFCN